MAKLAAPANAQVVEGVSVALKGMYLSRNQNSIGANLSITNTGGEAALVKVVGRESSFIIPGTVNRAMVQTNGIADCGLADTSSCLKHGLTTWSRLEPGRSYAAFVYSILSSRLSDIGAISSADVNLRLLVRRGNDGKPFDISFNSVDIGGQK